MKKPTETALVKGCLDALGLMGVFAWRVNQGAMRVPGANGSRERFVRFTRGVEGISDIIGILPGGRMLAVECKVGKNDFTIGQRAFVAQVTNLGGLAIVVRSIDELIERVRRELMATS
jgi:hypothetical protein